MMGAVTRMQRLVAVALVVIGLIVAVCVVTGVAIVATGGPAMAAASLLFAAAALGFLSAWMYLGVLAPH
jgi:hypothetical protein